MSECRVLRHPKQLYRLIGTYPRNSLNSPSVLPQEEVLMQDYARAKVRVKEYAHYKRARAVYRRVLEHHPEIAERDSCLQISERCMGGALAFVAAGIFFLLSFREFLDVAITLATIFGVGLLLFLYGVGLSIREGQSNEAKTRVQIFTEAGKWVDTNEGSASRRYALVLNEWKKECNGRRGRRYWCRFEERTSTI